MNDAVQDIKSRLNIEDMVGQYVRLKKAGRNFKGICPFHAEKTPSFIVSPEKGIAYCFGCHKGGDVFKFIQEVEGVDFIDALKILSERTGVELKQYQAQNPVSKDEKEQLLRIHELAAAFYEEQLWKTENGSKVLTYLRRRGLNDSTIRFFRLGFAPDDYEITHTMLLKHGFNRKMLVASGLGSSHETTVDKIYDRFRGRLMFPVADHLGRIVAFGGRALKKEQEPKYLNSPETLIYRKSSVLYGFFHAKTAIRAQKAAVLVEGYMDMIAACQSGIANAVAVSGTALTVQQLRLIKPFAQELYLAFDMDLAGQDAAKRAFELAQELDFETRVVELPAGKDIAEFAEQNGQKLANIIQKAQLYGDFLYRKLRAIYGSADFVAKRKILQEFFPFLSTLKSAVARDEYVRRLAHDLRITEKQIYDELKNIKLPQSHPARVHGILEDAPEAAGSVRKKFRADELFIGFLIEYPRIGATFKGAPAEECLSADMKAIYKLFFDKYNNLGSLEGEQILGLLPYELAEKASLLSLYVSEFYGEIGEEAVEREMKFLLDKIVKNNINEKRRALQSKIAEAEKNGQKEEYKRLMQALDNMVNI